ncbi:MAG: hypothetical protein ACR2M3_06870, partial [Thermomicrobiales bacterium]
KGSGLVLRWAQISLAFPVKVGSFLSRVYNMKRSDGQPVTTGRLVVERPDVVLLLGGDRSAGLDADALAAIATSIS